MSRLLWRREFPLICSRFILQFKCMSLGGCFGLFSIIELNEPICWMHRMLIKLIFQYVSFFIVFFLCRYLGFMAYFTPMITLVWNIFQYAMCLFLFQWLIVLNMRVKVKIFLHLKTKKLPKLFVNILRFSNYI